MELPDNDNIRKLIGNDKLVDAILKYKGNFEALISDECFSLDYDPLPPVRFGGNGGLLGIEALNSFCAEFEEKSAKDVLLLCLTERDYWKPTGSVLISVSGQKEPIPYTIGGEKSQLENIETPTLIRFTSADGRKMLIDPEKIENDLRDLFEFFYVFQLVKEEDLNRAFNKQLDRLKNPT